MGRPHDGYEHRQFVGRQRQQTSPCRLAPTKQMLRRHVVPTRHLRHDRAWRIGFRDNPPLGLDAPATPASNPDPDIDPASWLRSVNYMVDHMCEPICPIRFESCGSNRALQGGSREPLTSYQLAGSSVRLCVHIAPRLLRETIEQDGAPRAKDWRPTSPVIEPLIALFPAVFPRRRALILQGIARYALVFHQHRCWKTLHSAHMIQRYLHSLQSSFCSIRAVV